MRIEGWRIDGYGIFSGAAVDSLPPGLTVVAGPNEAGKSTLLAFLRGVLFGFPDGRMRAHRHEPVHGGRHGGAVSLSDDDGGIWVVERYAEPRSFTIRRPDGSLAEDHELDDLLGHADATLFSNVFAFGLSELDAFELLDSDAVRDRVFSAGVVGAGRSARHALTSLDARRTALVRPRGRCEVRDLADEARHASRVLAQARAAAADLERRRTDVERLADLAESRRAAADACRQDQHELRALLEAWPARSRLTDIEHALGEIEVPSAVDETFATRYERASAELEGAARALHEAERAVETAAARRDEITLDARLAELAPEIRAVAAGTAAEEERTARLDDLDRVVREQSDLLAEQLSRLGPDWDRGHLASFDVSIPTADDVRRRAARLSAVEAELDALVSERDELERDHADAEAALDDLRRQMDAARDAPASDDVERRARALRQLRAHLVDVGTAVARVDGAERSVAGLRAVLPPPTGAPTVGVGALVVGVLLGVVGAVAALGGAAAAAVALVTAGVVLAVVGATLLATRRSAVGGEVDELNEQIRAAEAVRDEARHHLEALRRDVAEVATGLGMPADPTALDVEERAHELEEAGEAARAAEALAVRLRELESRAALDEARLGELGAEITRLTEQVGEERDQWERWKRDRRIPPALGVEAINDLFTAVERARTTLRSLETAERERAQLDEASSAWRGRADALLDRAGRSGGGRGEGDEGDEMLLREVRSLAERAEADAQARRSLGTHLAAVEEAEETAELVCDRVAVARAERDALLVAAGSDDDASFRQVLARWHRQQELVAERRRAVERIHAALGAGEHAAPLLDELESGDRAGWEAALDDAIRRLPQLEAQHEEAIRMHHDAARQLEELSRSADVAEASLRWETARTRLSDAVAEWQTLSAARRLVADTLARYERERQPKVLARAEVMFATVTDGHYESLSVVDGDLSLVDHQGRRLATDDLSRGAVEQLYLCLRFGLAAEMAGRAPLPFVMDDVLVNFDPDRTARMARVIADLAAAHQVLVFTCQPATVEALRTAAPDSRVLDLPRHAGQDRSAS